jgi:hypothetical protein
MAKLKKTKEEIIKKAEELGKEYEAKYGGCCQSTFLAVVDALRWGGLEVISKDIEDSLYSGICLLTAGVCMTGEGTCGAVSGSVIASGFAFGIPKDTDDITIADKAGARIRDTLLARFYREYGSILCKDVMRKYFGKAWDLTSDKMTQEFLGITDGCVIRKTAGWATRVLLEEFEKGNIKQPS